MLDDIAYYLVLELETMNAMYTNQLIMPLEEIWELPSAEDPQQN